MDWPIPSTPLPIPLFSSRDDGDDGHLKKTKIPSKKRSRTQGNNRHSEIIEAKKKICQMMEVENGIPGGGTKTGMGHQIEINDEIGQKASTEDGDPMLSSYSNSGRFHSPPPTAGIGNGNEGKWQIKFAICPIHGFWGEWLGNFPTNLMVDLVQIPPSHSIKCFKLSQLFYSSHLLAIHSFNVGQFPLKRCSSLPSTEHQEDNNNHHSDFDQHFLFIGNNSSSSTSFSPPSDSSTDEMFQNGGQNHNFFISNRQSDSFDEQLVAKNNSIKYL